MLALLFSWLLCSGLCGSSRELELGPPNFAYRFTTVYRGLVYALGGVAPSNLRIPWSEQLADAAVVYVQVPTASSTRTSAGPPQPTSPSSVWHRLPTYGAWPPPAPTCVTRHGDFVFWWGGRTSDADGIAVGRSDLVQGAVVDERNLQAGFGFGGTGADGAFLPAAASQSVDLYVLSLATRMWTVADPFPPDALVSPPLPSPSPMRCLAAPRGPVFFVHEPPMRSEAWLFDVASNRWVKLSVDAGGSAGAFAATDPAVDAGVDGFFVHDGESLLTVLPAGRTVV
eukprot:TRINITY_DN7891_c0_g1_i1.p1 TRINITY_DN7891_c0_g1~~TRINITY_DN7891_c0_g1_i1.p1  ORF type:complete len:284 (+),score=21.00 TRINITY_DN7891_c0_g1_i1:143-994(+)